MAKVIGAKKIIELLETAVVEKGAGHKANCVYGNGDKPICIAGQVVYVLGGAEALDRLTAGRIYTGNFDNEVLEGPNPRVLKSLGLTDKASRVLQEAQEVQDRGGDWGFALDSAKQVANV